MKKYAVMVFIALFCVSISALSFDQINYPNAVHKLIIDTDKTKTYNDLAARIGFEIGKRYSYSHYTEIKKKNEVGTEGKYDFLLLSTGGNEWDYDAWQKFIQQPCGWETTYYKNHNLTIINEICNDPDGITSWVRIMKIAKGKRPNLHLE